MSNRIDSNTVHIEYKELETVQPMKSVTLGDDDGDTLAFSLFQSDRLFVKANQHGSTRSEVRLVMEHSTLIEGLTKVIEMIKQQED